MKMKFLAIRAVVIHLMEFKISPSIGLIIQVIAFELLVVIESIIIPIQCRVYEVHVFKLPSGQINGWYTELCAVVHFARTEHKFYFEGTNATNCGDDESHKVKLKYIK